MTKKILIGVGALALLIAAGAAWAHGPGRRFMMKQMITKHIAEAEDYIQATPQQRAQIESSRDVILNALQASAQTRRGEHQNIVATLTSPTLTEDQLRAIANDHVAQMQKLADVIIPEIKKVHDVLTPDQLSKLAQKAQQMRQKHQQNQGGFGGPGE
jgi:Spy/CpxP family protein refolding chaperone